MSPSNKLLPGVSDHKGRFEHDPMMAQFILLKQCSHRDLCCFIFTNVCSLDFMKTFLTDPAALLKIFSTTLPNKDKAGGSISVLHPTPVDTGDRTYDRTVGLLKKPQEPCSSRTRDPRVPRTGMVTAA